MDPYQGKYIVSPLSKTKQRNECRKRRDTKKMEERERARYYII
jgi:hypothetical protein